MGFMAGFGEGFTRQFEQSRNNRAAKEQDAFRLAYQDYVDKKKDYELADATWNNNIKKGQVIAQTYGAPPEAALMAAKWLQYGFSDAEVDKKMSQLDFSTAAPVAPDPAAPVDTQMIGAGLSAPPSPNPNDPASLLNAPNAEPVNPQNTSGINDGQPPVDPTIAPASNANNNPAVNAIDGVAPQTNENNDFLGGLFKPGGIFEHAGESDEAQAARKVQESAGISSDEFNKVQGGFHPPSDIMNSPDPVFRLKENPTGILEQFGIKDNLTPASLAAANAKATILEKSKNPKERALAAQWKAMAPEIAAQLVDQTDNTDTLKLLAPTYDQRAAIGDKRAAIESLISDGGDLIDMAHAAGGSALSGVGGMVAGFEGFKTDIGQIMKLVPQFASDASVSEEDVISQVEQQIHNLEEQSGGRITAEIAQNYNEFTSKMIRFVFAQGRALGQAGNGFSNKDFDNIMKGLQSSNNPDVFENNIKSIIKERLIDVDAQTVQLGRMPEIKLLAKDKNVGESISELLKPFGAQVKANPDTTWVFGPSKKATDPMSTYMDANGNILPGFTDPDTGAVFLGGNPDDPASWEQK